MQSHFVHSHFVHSHFVQSHYVQSHFIPPHYVQSHFVPPNYVKSHFVQSHFVHSHFVPLNSLFLIVFGISNRTFSLLSLMYACIFYLCIYIFSQSSHYEISSHGQSVLYTN